MAIKGFSALIYMTCLLVYQAIAQTSLQDSAAKPKKIGYRTTVGVAAGSSIHTPFWLRANQYDVMPLHYPAIVASAGIFQDYSKKKWGWGYGLDVWANGGKSNRVILPELYIKSKYQKLELKAGRWRQVVGLVGDTLLTSGSYILSGNSVPLPMVSLGLRDYVPLFGGVLRFKLSISHGWFDGNPVVRKHFLHQKTAYIKFGKDKWPLHIIGGFNHNVQWGGKIVTSNRWSVGRQNPQDWVDYWFVFTGKRLPTFGYVDPTKYDVIDRGNRVGNHLGSIDLALDIKMSGTKLMIYRQFLYDDGSLFYKANIRDGLNGISVRFKYESESSFYITNVLAEFLNTSNQGGSRFRGAVRGRDNYFNHPQFEGWVYMGNTIGTPFITPKGQTGSNLPDPGVYKYADNNRVKLVHLGVAGNFYRSSFMLKVSYSKNLGTYDTPFPPGINQFSGLIDLQTPFKAARLGLLTAKLSIATDLGKLYPRSSGLYFSLIKRGFL